ncbi:lysozyme inhibitor LprI family protein [Spirulina subsalsa FACHB-351]|uniref:Lysozyme inhibitor LprI family protein n=1 Tax=Spirulina subsalsa FACHB-351 TaxID=234711 RepID=A0ABT3L5Z5_9CYAN|nr:lysozyme inhibitor LprI family protein [Spirulina subsalsa]MCW6036900.1 lysozyme inhibitor LprI family protein [Spirulina subsalsa FACHB-351]
MKTAKHLIVFTATLALVIFSGCSTPEQTQASDPTPHIPSTEQQYTPSPSPTLSSPSSAAIASPSPSIVAQAPDVEEDLNCDDPTSQWEMNVCADQAAKEADARLNEVYRQLRVKVSGTPQESRLIEAEKAWIDFRDKDCEFSRRRYDGGTIMPMIYAMCVNDLTQRRTEQLEAYLEEW